MKRVMRLENRKYGKKIWQGNALSRSQPHWLAHGIIALVLSCGTAVASSVDAPRPLDTGKAAKPANSGVEDAEFALSSSTKFDFAEASIDGKMKAPEGFFLQGRKGQQMSNLMNLRSNFRRELTGSAPAAEVPPN